MDQSAKTQCPQEVVRAGAALVRLRRMAKQLEDAIDQEMPAIQAAIVHVCDCHGAKYVQAGEAKVSLRLAQTAPGYIMQAHNALRLVLGECGINEPSDKQIIACMSDDEQGEEKPGAEPASIR